MQYIKELSDYTDSQKSAVTFGKFDGLHKGHQKLVEKVRELGKNKGINSIVCSFDMRPLWKSKGIKPQMLMASEERYRHLERQVDYLVECPFTEEFSRKSAEDFIKDVIHDVFHATYVVVGTDFRFGHDKCGDVQMLETYAREYGYDLFVIEKERYEGRIISSTYIKDVLKEGNSGLASILLGYPYAVEGIVEHGYQLGRTLGFPTMNVLWPSEKIVPPYGVYFCNVRVDGKKYPGISNVGIKPTVSDKKRLSIESYLFGYAGEAYGKKVTVELLEFRRPEQKFDGLDELKAGIHRDIACGRQYFGIV